MDEARVEVDVAEVGADGARDDATNDELRQLRELIARAHPDAVPELIQGATLAEMLAALPAAQIAFARIVEQTRAEASALASVPAGGATRSPEARTEGLSPLGKIRVGLTRRGA